MATRKKQLFSYPYPRPSLTVDVVLVTSDAKPSVLLIQRKAEPFVGCWALPGGFVEEHEPPVDAARRELFEETGLEQADLEQLHTFGDPGRDPRGWTVSIAYMARVKPELLKPRASDDAADVRWFSLANLPKLAFDHGTILTRLQHRLADREG